MRPSVAQWQTFRPSIDISSIALSAASSCFSQSIADKADIFLPMYWIFLGTHFAYSAALAVFRPGNVQHSGRPAREWKLWLSVQRTVFPIVPVPFEPFDRPQRPIMGSYAPAMEPE
jgi:hypothetical protein